MSHSVNTSEKIAVIVPAAGVGSRMQADLPKQYLTLHGKTILEHTVARMFEHPQVAFVVVAIGDQDPYFDSLSLAKDPRVVRVAGGKERADSVLSGLSYLAQHHPDIDWVMVHDAARPCVAVSDVDRLIQHCLPHGVGGLLASPVRDTMKRGNGQQQVESTVDRNDLWHALTPQMFRLGELNRALEQALKQQVAITDEASAMEWTGEAPLLVTGRADNIKITQPEDLALAEFYLQRDLNKERE